ncbi:MAG: Zn-dependent oligopeptidase [Acidobacteria bacterium]|nr:Zn-dependent oligopeptidase [Acidobacteriota bacterium]
MRFLRLGLAVLLLSLLAVAPVQVAPAPAVAPVAIDGPGTAPFFAGLGDVTSFNAAMETRLAAAQQTLDRLLAVKAPHTVENTLRLYDDLSIAVSAASGPAGILATVHPDAAMRKAAEDAQERLRAFTSDLALNRGVYEALAAIDASRADAETQHYLRSQLRAYRLAGVDKDAATRERITQLQRDLGAAQVEFLRNIRANTRTLVLESDADLAGLPQDYIARHPPGPDGEITLTTNDNDVRPLLTFAKKEDVRKRMLVEFANIGYPANVAVLEKMIALRGDIARALGQPNWATADMLDRMSGSVGAVSEFIDRVVEASGRKAAREYDELLKRKKQDVPDATGVNAWENTYYSELVRRASYDFDAQSVRPYFPYARVEQGVLDVTSALYGVRYRPAKGVRVWDASVEAYEALEGGSVIGRLYLDMHPRQNKQNNNAITSTVRVGVAGRQLPEVVLVAAYPGGQPGDPGLMTHDEVASLFHEFGHAVHAILSARPWFGTGRLAERDFVEAPSQMFEEWTWDPATLATFAKHYQTNEPIPAALVNKMRRANEFGQALGVRQQMVFAKLSLSLHDRDPKRVDSTALVREITNKYTPFPYVEGTHRQTAFTHLANRNYTSSYYTYMWSLVIAKDLFSKFDQKNLLAPGIARKYRDAVLGQGGSKPAADLVRDFLGRPFNAKAWEEWLNRQSS